MQTNFYEHMDAFGWIQPKVMGKNPGVLDIYGWKRRSTQSPTQKLDAEVSGDKPSEVWIYDMPVRRIYVDNRHVLLYQNSAGITYRTLCKVGYDYPPETILHVYEIMGATRIKLYDDWGNTYTFVDIEILEHHTWQGRPVFHKENHKPRGVSSAYIPRTPRPRMGEMGGYIVNRGPNIPHQPRKKQARIDPQVRNNEFWGKKMTPTMLQKFSKKFDGTGDPYDHVAQFRQLVFAEGVTDMHTMVQGFGLTMMGKALTWFQTLKLAMLYDFDTLVKYFIESYIKIGIKHNTITQILSFRQKDIETIKECIDRLRQYIVRCLASETPSQECLISCFIEVLTNRQLYMYLFAKNHVDFDECCFDAQNFDDNCDLLHSKLDQDLIESGESSKNMEMHALVDLVLQKLRQVLKLI